MDVKANAQCHKKLHHYQEALDCLYKVETMQPDNLNLLLQIGQCLASLHMYDKACLISSKWNIWKLLRQMHKEPSDGVIS